MLVLFTNVLFLQNVQAQQGFKVVPLGVKGGLDESNLSAYMLAPAGFKNYVCLDAGTVYAGIAKTNTEKVFGLPENEVQKKAIKAYLISHPHLDHLAGLIISSPNDITKNIYGTASCLNTIQQHYFSWQTWANFADKGEKPALGKYHYKELTGDNFTPIENTELSAKAFILAHSSPFESTAFLLQHDSDYVLYLGDTGADTIEKSHHLQDLWQAITPLVNDKKLKGIFIEVSYPNEQPNTKLFGHLTPTLLMQELLQLASFTSVAALQNLPIIITHIKPEGNHESVIKKELKALNTLQVKLIFPQQGKPFKL